MNGQVIRELAWQCQATYGVGCSWRNPSPAATPSLLQTLPARCSNHATGSVLNRSDNDALPNPSLQLENKNAPLAALESKLNLLLSADSAASIPPPPRAH